MKKLFGKLLAISLVLALVLSVVACGMADAMAPNDWYDSTPDGEFDGENYTEIIENPFVKTLEKPDSYFSIDVNTASYPNIRRYIEQGYINFDKNAVRVEEMLNYFDYEYKTPTDGSVFALTSSVFDTPYNENTKLMTIGLAAQEIKFEQIQNNIVFLIDVSGSMNSANKLPLVQQSFSLLAENLNDNDRISIVTYAGSDRVVLEGAYGYEKDKILTAINNLRSGGSTAGSMGINRAYQIAEKYFVEGGNNRVILATDGDFNVGVTGVGGLEGLIAQKAKTGVYFSVFGFGTGNLQSAKMETLALNGNGSWGYIDSIKEAKRMLVEQIGGTLVTVAKDVKAGITFNPEYVESYRLIGYENKQLSQDQFEDPNTDAGEVGSGHKLTVAYEIVLTDKALVNGENLADVIVKYKPTENVGGDATTEQELVLGVTTDAYRQDLSRDNEFVAAVVEFALILRNSQYKGDANLADLIARLDAMDFANDEDRTEFREIVKQYNELFKQNNNQK
jgi:Ca-activated chloride channel family protein